jgi:thymidylate synthase
MILFKHENLANAYEEMCHFLLYNPEYETAPRDQAIHEILNAHIIITDPYQNLFLNDHRDLPQRYLKDELKLYFAGRRDREGFVKASKFWDNITDGNCVNSAYGYLIFRNLIQHCNKTQWQWALDSLKNDKDTRQALMFVANPFFQYEGNKDFICTTNYQFIIRNNCLNMTVNRRSQDIFFGLTYDVPWETLLMQCMLIELKDIYPDLSMGHYNLHCTSLHLYERNFNTIKEMLAGNFYSSYIPYIKDNPILHPELMHDKEYVGKDEFLKWLKQ